MVCQRMAYMAILKSIWTNDFWMNGMTERLSNRKWRELLGRYIFGTKETE
jgi:hypothetical protein